VQLVELQDAWPDRLRGGFALFAISYDPVAVLAAFAEKRGITFPLLSDEGSATIRALGLLNERLTEQHAFYGINTRDNQQGVAYPGTFVLDRDGIITAKHFEQSYRVRPTAAVIRKLALAAKAEIPSDALAVESEGISVRAWTDAPTYRPYQQLRLHVRLDLPDGAHVFAPPVPEGYTSLCLRVDRIDELTVDPPELPDAQPFMVDGLDERLLVYEGSVEATIPLRITKNLGATQLRLRVAYQTCTQTTCFPPSEQQVLISLEGLDLIRD
jgi:peroxiredoxin